ncbi:MAG: DUF4150 domain-containing protein [Ramlibacter sp.]|nr:DUF4150 domain-containing protein [Ramlibacter sp.]
MFANIILSVMNFAFPDVCEVPTPAGPVPLPFPNFAISIAHIPSQFNIIIGGGLAENLLTMGTISQGDDAGLLMGVVSHTVMAADRYILGSFKVCFGAIPASRLTSVTLANMGNMVGMTIVPSQFVVILME